MPQGNRNQIQGVFDNPIQIRNCSGPSLTVFEKRVGKGDGNKLFNNNQY